MLSEKPDPCDVLSYVTGKVIEFHFAVALGTRLMKLTPRAARGNEDKLR